MEEMTQQDREQLESLDVQLELAKQASRWEDSLKEIYDLYNTDMSEGVFKNTMEDKLKIHYDLFRDLTVFAGMIHAKKFEL